MRLRPLTFLTFQQFPFFHLSVNLSSSQSFISSFPLLIIIHPSFRLSFIIPVFYSSSRSFIHHPGHLFPHSASLSSFHSFHPHSSALPTLHRRSPHPRHIHHLSVISTISPSFPPSLRHSHRPSVTSLCHSVAYCSF